MVDGMNEKERGNRAHQSLIEQSAKFIADLFVERFETIYKHAANERDIRKVREFECATNVSCGPMRGFLFDRSASDAGLS